MRVASNMRGHECMNVHLPSTNQPPSLLMRACFTLNPSSVRHCTTWQQQQQQAVQANRANSFSA
jgi:hypothetical protein